MNNKIFIKGIQVHGFHGEMRHEVDIGQQFRIDIELVVDLRAASLSDELADTVCYGTAVNIVLSIFHGPPLKQLEALGEHIAVALLAGLASVDAVKVIIHKPHAPVVAIFTEVGTIVERGRTALLPQ
jgi:dihydroneopterin aldolase